MPIEKMQSQTTTYHVCGGDNLRHAEIRGLSLPFAGLLGARWFRDVTENKGRTVSLAAVGCRPCPTVWGGHDGPTGPVADATTPFPSLFWRVIHRQKLSTAQSSISLRFIDSGTRTPSPGLHLFVLL